MMLDVRLIANNQRRDDERDQQQPQPGEAAG
jgi:hypothetical protein